MARRIIGLDLGAYSVKLVRLEAGKQHLAFEVVDALEEVLAPAHVDGPDLLERQREVVAKFAQLGLLENEGAYVALPSSEGQMRSMSVPFSDLRKIEAILPGMIEAEVPFELSDMTFVWHRQEHKALEPTGGDETTIRLAFGKKQGIAALLHMLQPLAFDPRQILLGSSALYELIRHIGFENYISPHNATISALIDLGHTATNICIFDQQGIILTRSFLIGGEKLTNDIAQNLNRSFEEAQNIKHEHLDLLDNNNLSILGRDHYMNIADHISRLFITLKSSGYGAVGSVAFVGGAAKAQGLDSFYGHYFKALNCEHISLKSHVPAKISLPSMTMAYSLALSGIHLHAKESRFNFRKDEFAWRGEYDFLRSKSTPLIIWGLVITCLLALMWSSRSLVLDKENKALEAKIHAACAEILNQGSMPAKKCLTLMREQISTRAEVEIPSFTATDAYLRAAQGLAKDLNIVIYDMDISEKKVRVTAEAATYEDIDKIAASWAKIPCFVKVENTGAQPFQGKVKFTLTNDIDCQATPSKASSEGKV
jgi:general secretion pathway protein L